MPNNEENVAILKDRMGRQVALKGVNVKARLHGLMAEVEVEQSYVNPHKTNIEAVYTFPLPIGAVLLGLQVEIAGKKLTGTVVERKQAERDYEDAVTDGDSAVMLEEAGPGLYTASIGNLMAGESAVIRYRYGLMLSWQGPRLRFLLPTTIAPRYGDAVAAGLQPHQIPQATLDVEYPLELAVTVEGELASAAIASPSHAITFERSDSGVVARLSGKAVLDRDFVLAIESATAQSDCVVTQDRDKQVAVASLRIPPTQVAVDKSLALKIVIDCSGSMAGISIAQVRKGALEILNLLSPKDAFNVTLFGSAYKHLFKSMVPATAKNITEAWKHLEKLDAEMGGTEMEKALDASFALSCPEGEATLLLLTDGEIYEHAKLVKRAEKSGHRVFTVGVGTAVAETFLKTLAQLTGGACELVAPQEGMAERMLSQFHRMRQPKLRNLSIEWPVKPEWMTTLPETVFAGDTVHVFAGFQSSVFGSVILKTEGSADVTASISQAKEAEIPRIAAARRMEAASAGEGLHLALDYQLLSHWTNYLVIAERSDKAVDLPELHQMPQMLAAGWGGTAGVVASLRSKIDYCASIASDAYDVPEVFQRVRGARNASVDEMRSSGIEKYDVPAFLRKQADDDSTPRTAAIFSRKLSRVLPRLIADTPQEFIANLQSDMSGVLNPNDMPATIETLEAYGLPTDIANDLRELSADGWSERILVAAFLMAMTKLNSLSSEFSRAMTRLIFACWKRTATDMNLLSRVEASVLRTTPIVWHWALAASDDRREQEMSVPIP